MTDTPEAPAPEPVPAPAATVEAAPADTPANAGKKAKKPKKEENWKDTAMFVVKLAIVVFIFRSFIFSPFNIPSQSMLPRLFIGDYLFVSKWNYGYSRHSLPWSLPLIPGRIFGRDPTRGDIIVFKAPPQNEQDYIKRMIGLPGDTVQMRNGQLILNGVAVPKVRVADFVIPLTPNYNDRPKPDPTQEPDCPAANVSKDAAGKPVCRYAQFKETLPNGVSYMVLDSARIPEADDTDLYTVPAGHVFMMGDNRDNSLDSRFAHSRGGISYVPMENLEGKAVLSFWSTDGTASWILPWTWFSAARWERMGQGY